MNQLATQSEGIAHYQRTGQIERLPQSDKDKLYNALCERYNLDPILRPFQLIAFGGQQKFYMTAAATNQIADIRGLTRKITEFEINETTMIGKCSVLVSCPQSGRSENTTTFMNLSYYHRSPGKDPVRKMLEGEDLANALNKLDTKAKRRATMSFIGVQDAVDDNVQTLGNAEKATELKAPEALPESIEVESLPPIASDVVEPKPEPKPEPKKKEVVEVKEVTQEVVETKEEVETKEQEETPEPKKRRRRTKQELLKEKEAPKEIEKSEVEKPIGKSQIDFVLGDDFMNVEEIKEEVKEEVKEEIFDKTNKVHVAELVNYITVAAKVDPRATQKHVDNVRSIIAHLDKNKVAIKNVGSSELLESFERLVLSLFVKGL